MRGRVLKKGGSIILQRNKSEKFEEYKNINGILGR